MRGCSFFVKYPSNGPNVNARMIVPSRIGNNAWKKNQQSNNNMIKTISANCLTLPNSIWNFFAKSTHVLSTANPIIPLAVIIASPKVQMTINTINKTRRII